MGCFFIFAYLLVFLVPCDALTKEYFHTQAPFRKLQNRSKDQSTNHDLGKRAVWSRGKKH